MNGDAPAKQQRSNGAGSSSLPFLMVTPGEIHSMHTTQIFNTATAVLILSLATACVFSSEENVSPDDKDINAPKANVEFLLTGEDAGRRIANGDFERLRMDITEFEKSDQSRRTPREPTGIPATTLEPPASGQRWPDAADQFERQVLAQLDFYRAEGLPHLFGSGCRGQDRAVIAVEYTHSIISGNDWRGGANANVRHQRGKYGEPLQYSSDGVDDGMRLYGYDYYARGLPGETVILGWSGTSSEDRCMIGVLTNEGLQPKR